MSISPKWKYRLKQILPFGVIWFILGALFLSIEEMAIGDWSQTSESAIRLEPDIVVYALIGIFFIGCIFGAIHVLWLEKVFKDRSFTKKLLFEFAVYLAFLEFMLLLNYPIVASMEQDVSLFDGSVWLRLKFFFWSVTHLSALIQMAFSILVSLFYNEISNTVGQNVLFNFFMGKYHHPVNEERIFMFLDMKDSTTIAEKLGNAVYFNFLQAYYSCFSDAIIAHYGEVYQYVGDEIVISWSMEKGSRNANCVQSFFAMKEAIQAKETYFKESFGIAPDFKAAIHFGAITTGEIGALKKDIFFTGDVLNTTARILGKSAAYQEDLLVSEDLVKQLRLDETYEIKNLGTQALKGKTESVNIASVNLKA